MATLLLALLACTPDPIAPTVIVINEGDDSPPVDTDTGGDTASGDTADSAVDSEDSGDTAGDSSDDTADSGTTIPEALAITGWSADYDVDAQTVTWTVETTGTTGPATVALSMIQANDAGWVCVVECGVWREDHDTFVANGGSFSLVLDVVWSATDQATNHSTLFEDEIAGLAVLWKVTDTTGATACLIGGYPTDHYDADCAP